MVDQTVRSAASHFADVIGTTAGLDPVGTNVTATVSRPEIALSLITGMETSVEIEEAPGEQGWTRSGVDGER